MGGPEPAEPPSHGGRLALVILGLSTIWGTTYFVIREGLADLPPFTSAGLRFTLAAIVMWLVAPWLAKKEGGERPTLALTLVQGLFTVATGYGIVYWSETILPSGLVSVLWATFPMLIAFIAHFTLGEILTGRQWLGFLVGFVGVVVLFFTDLAAVGTGALTAGLITLGSPALNAFSQSFVKAHGRKTSSVLLNRNGFFVGGPLLLLAGFLFEREAELNWTPRAIFSVLYLSIVGTLVAFGVYFWAMRWAPAHKLSLIAYLVPVLALTVGYVLGEEPLAWHTVLGTGIILTGVGLVSKRRA